MPLSKGGKLTAADDVSYKDTRGLREMEYLVRLGVGKRVERTEGVASRGTSLKELSPAHFCSHKKCI